MAAFEATVDFWSALQEVDFLVEQAAGNEQRPTAQATLNKAAILLLTAKIEAFIEQIVEEFCYRLGGHALECQRLPESIRMHASRRLLNADFMCALEQCKVDKTLSAFGALSTLWQHGCVVSELKVDASFAYGRHGEKEIRKLFQRIGVGDVFSVCRISDDRESLDELPQDSSEQVNGDVNALTGYRNFIIHNDGNPNVTHEQIAHYKTRLSAFAEKVDEYVWQMLSGIANTTESVGCRGHGSTIDSD